LTMPEEVQLDKCIHEPPKCPKRIPSKNLWIKLLDAIVCRAHVLLSSWNRWLVINNSVRSVLLSPGCISCDFNKKFAYQYARSVPLRFSGGAWQVCLMIIYLQHTIEQKQWRGSVTPLFHVSFGRILPRSSHQMDGETQNNSALILLCTTFKHSSLLWYWAFMPKILKLWFFVLHMRARMLDDGKSSLLHICVQRKCNLP
jgi:hypothetical protein